MFSRAAKSVVKSLGSRQIHIGKKNFKPSRITTIKKPCSIKSSHPNATINNARTDDNIAHNLSNLQANNGKSQTDQLVEALYHLPIAEEASTLNSLLIPNEIIPKAANVCSRMRPYARISEMDPSNRAWQRDYTIAAICKSLPDMIHLPFQEYDDISLISESKYFKNHQSIKRKKGNENLFYVAKRNHFLSNYEEPTTELMKECRNAEIFSNIEARYRTTEKSTNWVTNWVKSKLLHEICNHSRGYISWFLIKAFAVNNVSINLINDYLSKKRNIDNKGAKIHCFIKCKNNDIVVSRNSEAITGDTLNTVEEENWIQRISYKIKSILPDLHAKIRSRSTTVLNLYYSENIFAVNESIPISEVVISNRIFFASKDCDSKSRIRRKIEEFCLQRKKSLRKKVEKDDICKKRERSCKTAEKKCQKKEKTCGKKEVDCSKRRKQTCQEQRKVSCKKRKDLDKDVRDCRKTREIKQEESSKEYKDCDTSKTKEDFCQKQRRVEKTSCSKSAAIKQTEKDTCKKSEKEEYQKLYEENDKCTKETKRRKEEDGKASCKQRQKETCQEKKKTDYEEEEKSKKSECSKIRKIDLCKKKECPSVTKAPDCSDGNRKTDEKEKTCRKYSTYALQNNSQRSDENH